MPMCSTHFDLYVLMFIPLSVFLIMLRHSQTIPVVFTFLFRRLLCLFLFGRAVEVFVLCWCSRSFSFFLFCNSIVRCFLSRFTFASHNERVRYSFCFVHCSVLGYLVRFYFLISYYLLLCCVLPQGLCKPNGSECHFTTPQETRTRFI